MNKYRCIKCSTEFNEKIGNCPNCGERVYYCHYPNCDKQLMDGKHQFCAVHGGKVHQAGWKIVLGLLAIFVFFPLLVFGMLISKGKIDPIDWIKKLLKKN